MYPTLTEKLQGEWDETEQARYEGLITEQVRSSLVERGHNIGLILVTDSLGHVQDDDIHAHSKKPRVSF